MTTPTNTDAPLAADLESIAAAAETTLRARGEHDQAAEAQAHRQLVEAAGAAMSSGRSLGEIADAERRGHDRARSDLAKEILPRVHRAARRMRDAIADYEQLVAHAARIGVAPVEIAAAAEVLHRGPATDVFAASSARSAIRTVIRTASADGETRTPDPGAEVHAVGADCAQHGDHEQMAA
jgi:hypothetical protein